MSWQPEIFPPILSPSVWQRIATTLSPVTAGDDVSIGTGLLKSSALTLVDATRKFLPVEILGTNLPANTGVVNSDIILFGVKSATDLSIVWNKTTGYLGGLFELWYNNSKKGLLSCYNGSDFGIFIVDGNPTSTPNSVSLGIQQTSHYMTLKEHNGGNVWYRYVTNPAGGADVPPASATYDGVDLSEYITAWQLGLSLVTNQAGGYTNCVAGDLGKVVTDDGTVIGILYAYNNTTRVWTVRLYQSGAVANGSVMAITAGTGAGTSTGASTESATRRQNVKKSYMTATLDGAGGAVVYLTADGTAGGTALYVQKPVVIRSAYSATVPTVALSADFKTLTLAAGGAADTVGLEIIGEVA